MGATKKTRKAYKPRFVPAISMVFATTPEQALRRSTSLRIAVDRIIRHVGTEDDLYALQVECVALQRLAEAAAAKPTFCPYEPGALAQITDSVQRIGLVLHEVEMRRKATGVTGCNAQQRGAIAELADLFDQLITGMPRRLWRDAYALACKNPELHIEVATENA